MNTDQTCILTINGGSSSIKFAIYQINGPLKHLLHGNIDRIGLTDSKLTFNDGKGIQRYGFHGLSYSYLMEERAPVISKDSEQVIVRVIHAEEEWMIAKTVSQMIKFSI